MKNTLRKNMKNKKTNRKHMKGGFWPFNTSVMSWFGYSQPAPEPVSELPAPEPETVPEETLPEPDAEPVYDSEVAPEGITESVMETNITNMAPEYENKFDERRSNLGGKKSGGKKGGKKTKKKKRGSSKKMKGKKLK